MFVWDFHGFSICHFGHQKFSGESNESKIKNRQRVPVDSAYFCLHLVFEAKPVTIPRCITYLIALGVPWRETIEILTENNFKKKIFVGKRAIAVGCPLQGRCITYLIALGVPWRETVEILTENNFKNNILGG